MASETKKNANAFLIAQRMRNRVIEYLGLASDFSGQIRYQEGVPLVNASNEVINQWYDVMSEDGLQECAPPLYTKDEINALYAYHNALEKICAVFPDNLPNIQELQKTLHWQKLRDNAEKTLKVMMRRGAFSDDIEQKEFM